MNREIALSMYLDLQQKYLPTSITRHGGKFYPEEDFRQFNEIGRTCGLAQEQFLSESLLEQRLTAKNSLEEGHEALGDRKWIRSSVLDTKLRETIASLGK
jgi:hypothetical protein